MPRFHDDALAAHIGAKIRALRIARRMSQTDAGELLGVSFQQFQKYENGKDCLSAPALHHLAEKLDAPLRFFFPASEREPEMPELSLDARRVPRRARSERHALRQPSAVFHGEHI